MKRDVLVGGAAGLTALGGMAGWALLGVGLLGLGGTAAPAAVALAVGGSVELGERVTGSISLLPLGVSLVGAVLLTIVLTNWQRVAGAVAVFAAGLIVLPFLPAGQFDVGPPFGAIPWLVAVVGVRVAMWRLPWVRRVALVLVGAAGAAMATGVVVSFTGGTKMLGTMLLAAPNLLAVALTRGFGVPWELAGPNLPLPTIETGGLGPLEQPLWPLAVLATAVVVLIAVFARWHAPWVTALCWAVMAWLGGAQLSLRAGPFPISLGLTGDVFIAAGVGLAAGSVACLLVAGARQWQIQRA
ncbi:hypothetical protein [Amycolatopsis magusensis]|uniref:hypothetical protein n=1 Tax=Amycolatopsis magusensis TaxID=882444 RepID=UPI0024A7B536|nr:hypothetical protein [Amycolatopsis magusensis]MDI5975089.1 hypothetical protein [Amycolatopsis magusensis]